MKKYALFPGCLISSRLPHLESITLKVLEKLGIKVELLENVTCCPEMVSAKMVNVKAWYTIAARNICLAEEKGLDMLTLCNGCNATLFRVNEDLKRDAKLRLEVNRILKEVGRKFEGKISVKSLLRVLYQDVGQNEIKKYVRKPLHGFKVAVHYGCHIFDEIAHYDDIKKPKSLKDLVTALGADVISYSSEMLCCGGFALPLSEEISLKLAEEKLIDLVNVGADCLVVICPYCFLQYDTAQALLNERYNKNFEIPVLYYSQLLGVAMGLSYRDIGLEFHEIKSTKLAQLISGY